jgi:serine/threonine protein kinase
VKDESVVLDATIDHVLGQVADEFTERLNRGEQPSIEEYVNRHPEIADQLQKMLEMARRLHRTNTEIKFSNDDPNLRQPLGDFQLICRIGKGGMGVVYLAEQISMNRRHVAVKLLPKSIEAMDSRHLERFKNEAHAAGRLNHENIVPVYSVGCERGQHYYAMQYINGLSLADVIKRLRGLAEERAANPDPTGPYSSAGQDSAPAPDTLPLASLTTAESTRSEKYFDIVARLGLQAARGLAHAHQHSVWHRDIKPANLLVDARDNLWITDFGLAQIRDVNLTIPGQLVGTLRYMSPEQTLAKRVPLDERTDVYSLGATLYELLTLEPAFNGVEREEIIRQIMFDDPVPPRKKNRRAPRDLETIVMTALARSPDHRYPSAREMAEDLQRFLDRDPIKARPEGWLRWLWRKTRRHSSRLIVGLSVLVSLAFLALFLAMYYRPTAEQREQKRQQEALAALNRDLDQKKSVTLIGQTGRPGYYRWVSAEEPGKTVIGPEGEFSIQNWEYGLLELLPNSRFESYRFRAEVRHERQGHLNSRVGIYFGHSQFTDDAVASHVFCTVSYNDLSDMVVENDKVRLAGNPLYFRAHRQLSTWPKRITADFLISDKARIL